MSEEKPETSKNRERGSNRWLDDILSSNKALPAVDLTTVTIELPASIREYSDGDLVELDIRGLPERVEIVGGKQISPGGWHLDSPSNVAFDVSVPEDAAIPFPLALTFRCGFQKPGSDERWYEVLGHEVSGPGVSSPQSTPEEPSDEEQLAFSPTPLVPFCVIDLDVSVGADDGSGADDMWVQFDGLPSGGWMSVGEPVGEGGWRVLASQTSQLSISVPEETPDFDLDVLLRLPGEAPQSASIRVETDYNGSATGRPMHVRLASPSHAKPIRFKVFADGALVLDRVIYWGSEGDVPVELTIFLADDAPAPFEVLIRTESPDGDASPAAAFLRMEFESTTISPTSEAIEGRALPGIVMREWQGDLIIDLNRAQSSVPATQESVTEEQSSITEPDTDLGTETGSIEIDAVQSEPATSAEPIVEDQDESLHSPSEDKASSPVVSDGVLEIEAGFDDLRRPGFLKELRQLRDFISTRPDADTSDYYKRLGISVGKWKGIRFTGPGGADVELDPLLNDLAPIGGRDNARQYHQIQMPLRVGTGEDDLLISGMPPGAMLSEGQNMGGGEWRLSSDQAARVRYLGPTVETGTVSLHVRSSSSVTEAPTVIGSVVAGATSRVLTSVYRDAQRIDFRLDSDVFNEQQYQELSVTVGDVPPGIMLMNGRNHGQGVWTLDTESEADIRFQITSVSQPFTVTVTCVAMKNETGESTVVTRRIHLDPLSGDVIAEAD